MPVFCESVFESDHGSAHLIIDRQAFIERRLCFRLHFKTFRVTLIRNYAGKSLVEPITR